MPTQKTIPGSGTEAIATTTITTRIGNPMKSKIKKKLPRKEYSMSDAQLEKMTIKDLKELRLRVDSAIVARQADERNSLREKFRAMAEESGLSLNEILGGSGRGGKGKTVAAKFANPANPEETWTGRGRQPRWLVAKLKSGARIDDFRL